MYLFKAKQAALAEYERALSENGLTKEEVQAFLESSPRFRNPFFKAAHVYAGNSADLVAAVAPYIKKTRAERWRERLTKLAKGSKAAARKTPHVVVSFVENAVKQTPQIAQRVKEDVSLYRELRAQKKRAPEATLDAAAEE